MHTKQTINVVIPLVIQYLTGSVSRKYVPMLDEVTPLHIETNTARYPAAAINTPRINHQLC